MPDTGHSVGHLVPVWIVYVDGKRLEAAQEGAGNAETEQAAGRRRR